MKDTQLRLDDEIVEEVRRAREAYLARFGFDLRAMGEDLRARTDQLRREGRTVVSLIPRRPAGWDQPARKVG